jgi:hypothetical protein
MLIRVQPLKIIIMGSVLIATIEKLKVFEVNLVTELNPFFNELSCLKLLYCHLLTLNLQSSQWEHDSN